MNDRILQKYRNHLVQLYGAKRIPMFAPEARHTVPMLALLQDPGCSGAEKSGMASLDNKDPTSRNQKQALDKAKVDRRDVLFWNYYAAYDINKFNNQDIYEWEPHFLKLVNLLKNLKVIIVCGRQAERAVKKVASRHCFIENDRLLYVPHPAARGLILPGKRAEFEAGWCEAKRIVDQA